MTHKKQGANAAGKLSFSEIVYEWDFATTEQIAHAREIRQSELDSITVADMRAGRRARMLGEILMDLAIMTFEEVEHCLYIQRRFKPVGALLED